MTASSNLRTDITFHRTVTQVAHIRVYHNEDAKKDDVIEEAKELAEEGDFVTLASTDLNVAKIVSMKGKYYKEFIPTGHGWDRRKGGEAPYKLERRNND